MKNIQVRSWNPVSKQFQKVSLDNSAKWQQNTGYIDKSGKEIFEGDIVKIVLTNWKLPGKQINGKWEAAKTENICEVRFRKSAGWIGLVRVGKYKGKTLMLKNKTNEIIGNIYETPKLINPIKQTHPRTDIFLNE